MGSKKGLLNPDLQLPYKNQPECYKAKGKQPMRHKIDRKRPIKRQVEKRSANENEVIFSRAIAGILLAWQMACAHVRYDNSTQRHEPALDYQTLRGEDCNSCARGELR